MCVFEMMLVRFEMFNIITYSCNRSVGVLNREAGMQADF